MNSRHDLLEPLIHPTPRLFWGLGAMVLFFSQSAWEILALDLIAFGALGALAGKKINLLYFGFFAGSITIFSLLAPQGEVFFSIGPWDLTWGALEVGLIRGLSLTGMIFISLFSISPKLHLPGKMGSLMSRVFFYFHNLVREKKTLRMDHLWEDVDDLLERVYSQKPGQLPPHLNKTKPGGWILMALVLIFLTGGIFVPMAAFRKALPFHETQTIPKQTIQVQLPQGQMP